MLFIYYCRLAKLGFQGEPLKHMHVENKFQSLYIDSEYLFHRTFKLVNYQPSVKKPRWKQYKDESGVSKRY